MKWIALIILATLPLGAQRRRDFSKEDDQQAVSFYQNALKGQANAGLFLQAKKETYACNLIVNYEQLEWVEEYSAKRSATLGKIGITPAAVKPLKTESAKRLIQDLVKRMTENRPLKEPYMYCICGGGMCGTAIVELSEIYQLGNLLDNLIAENPSTSVDLPLLDEAREAWKRSVVKNSAGLDTKCKTDLEEMPDEWQKYSQECQTLVKALQRKVNPVILGLDQVMAAKLRSALTTR